MSEKQVRHIFRSLADEKAPAESIDLWAAIKSRMPDDEGAFRRNSRSRLRLVGATLALVLLAGVVFLLTPQGQAWAQDAFQFFNKTESDRMSFDAYEATQTGSTSSLTPEGTAEPTPTQEYTLNNRMSMDEVQIAAGFIPYQPTWLPEGYAFAGALFDEETKVVTLIYEYLENGNNSFILRQGSYASLVEYDISFIVGSSADIQEVWVNGEYGEYVEGTWAGDVEDTVWENDTYRKRMIWKEGGRAFEIMYIGFPHYLLKDDMVAVAESLSANLPESYLDDYLTLEEIQARVDFPILQPTLLPDGFEFDHALYDQDNNVVTLMYEYGGNVNNAIGLKIEPISDLGTCYLCRLVGSSALIHEVTINGVKGEYVEGVWTLEDGEVIWKSYSEHRLMKTLIWQADGMIFNLSYFGDSLLKDDLVVIAESIQ